MTTAESQQGQVTAEEIVRWRYDQLRRAGCDRRTARLVSEERQIDLHDALRLVENGCPAALVVQILL